MDYAWLLIAAVVAASPAVAAEAGALSVPPAGAPDSHFVATWETSLQGDSITIPVGGATGTYTVDWGDGTGIAGDWTLRASDRAGGDAGTLNGWMLTIGHGTAGSPVTGLAGSSSQYLVTVSAARDGTYNLDLVSSGHGIADVADNPLSSPTPTGADHTYTRTGP